MKKKYIVIALAIVLAFGVLWACAPAAPDNYSGDVGDGGVRDYDGGGLSRRIDDEAGVVCYIYNSRAISCLPISSTNLQ